LYSSWFSGSTQISLMSFLLPFIHRIFLTLLFISLCIPPMVPTCCRVPVFQSSFLPFTYICLVFFAAYSFWTTMKMEAVSSSINFVPVYQSTWHRISEYWNLK
jgi:hypothetical protein